MSMVTFDPAAACVPPAGCSSCTRPSWSDESTGVSTSVTVKPACWSVSRAVCSSCPTTSGTLVCCCGWGCGCGCGDGGDCGCGCGCGCGCDCWADGFFEASEPSETLT